jgi:hypothetical protein
MAWRRLGIGPIVDMMVCLRMDGVTLVECEHADCPPSRSVIASCNRHVPLASTGSALLLESIDPDSFVLMEIEPYPVPLILLYALFFAIVARGKD